MIIGLFLMVALLGTMTTTATAMHGMDRPEDRPMPGMPDHSRMNDGSVWINTDIITIMANGETPQLHFWFTSDEGGTLARFSTNYVMLIEFEDLNDDGAYQRNEYLYFAPLSAFEWTISTGEVVDDDITTEVWLKYTKSGVKSSMMPGMPMFGHDGMGDIERFSDVTLQIWAHIYLDDYVGTVSDDHGIHFNYTVAGRSELKMDIEIGNFPFSSENSSVAIQTIQKENEATGTQNLHHHRMETRERFRNVSFSSDMNWTTTGGNETRFERMNDTECHRIDFMDQDDGITQGFFSWLDTAVITWPGGETEAVDVEVSYVPRGDGVAVYLAYPYFDDGSILHDPSIGLYPEGAPDTGILLNYVLITGIGGIALVALLVVLVRKK
nr:MAG: hypothetical protein AM325_03980 [Candidatus Thorarchaeota archaeon SMTZ1-45]